MDGYHTNQDGQWKTSDQWRAEEDVYKRQALSCIRHDDHRLFICNV